MARSKDVKKADAPVSLYELADELSVPVRRLEGLFHTGTITPCSADGRGLLFQRKPVEQFLRFAGDLAPAPTPAQCVDFQNSCECLHVEESKKGDPAFVPITDL